jgi:hypothetical protein
MTNSCGVSRAVAAIAKSRLRREKRYEDPQAVRVDLMAEGHVDGRKESSANLVIEDEGSSLALLLFGAP